jgi:type II secretory pathway component PulM
MLAKTQNPILVQLSKNINAITQALNVSNGKSPQELKQYVRNTAKTQGVDLNQLANKLGLQLPQ